jgi:hypothetical protein
MILGALLRRTLCSSSAICGVHREKGVNAKPVPKPAAEIQHGIVRSALMSFREISVAFGHT